VRRQQLAQHGFFSLMGITGHIGVLYRLSGENWRVTTILPEGGSWGLWADLKLGSQGLRLLIKMGRQFKRRHSVKHDEHIFAAQFTIPVHNVLNQFVQNSDQNIVVVSWSTGFISITRIGKNFTIPFDPMLMTIKPNTLPDRLTYGMKQSEQIVLIRPFVYPISRNFVCRFQILMRCLDSAVVQFVGFIDLAKVAIGLRYEAFKQDLHTDRSIDLCNVQHVMTTSKMLSSLQIAISTLNHPRR
ncbi:hypothetical protein TX24_23280, partial [Pseudomonas lactis]